MLLNVFHWIRCSFNNWRKIDKLYGTKSAILYALRTACKDFFFTKPIRYRHNSCIFKTLTQIKLFYSHKFSVWRENIIVTLVFCWKNCWWFYKKKNTQQNIFKFIVLVLSLICWWNTGKKLGWKRLLKLLWHHRSQLLFYTQFQAYANWEHTGKRCNQNCLLDISLH